MNQWYIPTLAQSFLKLDLGSEFSIYKIQLQNRITQNGATFPVNNLNTLTEILLSSDQLDFIKHWISLWVTNPNVKLLFFHFRLTRWNVTNAKFQLELLTWWISFYLSNFKLARRWNKKIVEKKKIWKIKHFTSRYWLESKLLFFHFWVVNLKLKNKKFQL